MQYCPVCSCAQYLPSAQSPFSSFWRQYLSFYINCLCPAATAVCLKQRWLLSPHWCVLKQELILNLKAAEHPLNLTHCKAEECLERSTAEAKHLYLCIRNQDSLQILTLDAITGKLMFFRSFIPPFIPPETVDNALGFPQTKV